MQSVKRLRNTNTQTHKQNKNRGSIVYQVLLDDIGIIGLKLIYGNIGLLHLVLFWTKNILTIAANMHPINSTIHNVSIQVGQVYHMLAIVQCSAPILN